MTPVADPPAAVAPAAAAKPGDVVVVSRDARNEVLASTDTPLPLIKAGRTEDAVLRQAVFLTGALTVVRPADGAGGDSLRWAYQSYLQRQLCFTSMTGQFSCAAAEVDELTESAAGEAPVARAPDPATPAASPSAEAARSLLAATLRGRADALFEDDRRLRVAPMLKAAGVSVRRIRVATGEGQAHHSPRGG